MRIAVLHSCVFAVLSTAAALAQSTFDDVHPVYRTRCADCHDYQGNGNLYIANSDIATAYANSQLPSDFVPGQTKGFATLVRIQNGDMPLGAGCTGDPGLDAGNQACLTSFEQGLLQAWIQAGQLGPLPPTGTTYCFGDGSGAACPCGNNGAADGGCASSASFGGGKLVAAGVASVTADSLVLRATRMPNGPALYFQGTARSAGGVGAVFGDGLRCVSGTVVRFPTQTNFAGASQYPQYTEPAISLVGGIPAQGATRHYQVWYRNAANFCLPATFNLTNGVSVTWIP